MTKSWVEKRDCSKDPHVKILDKPFAGIQKGCKMLVSSPQEIDAFIQEIPAGIFIEPAQMRDQLAQKHSADATCPVSTGIFLRIVAEAALEERHNGKALADITPFWRAVSNDSSTAKKLPIDSQELDVLRQLHP